MEQLEYNNETLAQATNVQEEVEAICRWAAARAAGIAALPKFNYPGLLANDVYITYTKEYTGNITFSVYGKKTDKLSPKIWVEGGGLTYTLYRQIGSKIDKFSSYYSKPKQ